MLRIVLELIELLQRLAELLILLVERGLLG
jgi:hypothetical protein